MRGFFAYYKWHLFFLIIVVACAIFTFVSLTTTKSSDLFFSYVGIKYINVQTFDDSKMQFEVLMQDANDDNEKTANISASVFDKQKEVEDGFAELIDNESTDVYIATKETFESYADKSKFEDVDVYLNINEKKHVVLRDSDGRAYAISIEKNEFTKDFGINEPEGLYIAVAAPKKGEKPTQNQKNARNVTQWIITNG